MRMRKMKNLEPRTEACAAYRITDPATRQGAWRELKPDATALWVEVGCGKGKFTAETAAANPDVLVIAIERCREAMVVAMEKAKNMGLTNVFFVDMDVALMEGCFAFGEIDRIVGEVSSSLQRDFNKEVPSAEIGNRVMEALRLVDEVAFVRFASVYRKFTDAADFIQEIQELKK